MKLSMGWQGVFARWFFAADNELFMFVYLISINRQERQMSENNSEFAKIIAKAWRDPVFKAELIANPVA